ncbi:VCBS repeat-containing protein [Amycolatopsis sp. SID8362]|uniref:C40 family peptidase n=1 Tax=Amycolatopsis sp. SID8362 TaxID=2690346 RepID=UPI00136E0E53|nr:VCBS repeat-containing protein [Amycolatopsis sp. SID8362]NBH05118.1 hypothetical protein [Amycolatopsis sp. SID8362]NED41818.1 hypothetical protein [Amycolatopsis sp. SID8362]
MLACVSYDANQSVTRAAALTRSLSWVRERVPYSQSNCYHNEWGTYRTDCSGFVSMAWGLRMSYTTDTLDQVSHPIARADLRPGDALLRPGHVALFIGWEDAAQTQPRVREEAGPDGAPAREGPWSQSYAATYTPVRYDNIVEGSVPRNATDGSDIDGDGEADLLGLKPDGALFYYHNDGTADGHPFSGSGTQIGTGFGVFDWINGADISGDGSADLLARKPDGSLWYYGNNRSHNAGGVPFAGSGTQIGSGFDTFTRLDAADIDGDGAADLLGLKANGSLFYYHNDGTADGHPFNGSGTQIGTGFGVFDWIDGADVSGDGSADLLARKPDGSLWYYGNNRSQNPGGVPFAGTGTQIGSGFAAFDRLRAADLSGDGSADLVARKPDGSLWYYGNNRSHNAGGVPFTGSGTQIGTGFDVFTELT